jgi:outer membrane protein assembly factor BamA
MSLAMAAASLALACFFAGPLEAFPQLEEKASNPAAEKSSGLLFLPVIFYTPETKWALGGGGMYYFQASRDKSIKRPCNISGIVIYSQRKQLSLELNPDFYFERGYHVQARVSYSDFPDKFYGIGKATRQEAEEDYTSRNVKFSLEVLKEVYPALNAGFLYFYDEIKLVKTEEGGLLKAGRIPGSGGGRASGLGYFMTWDSRDSIFFATSGSYHQFSAAIFRKPLGSDFVFNRYYFDLRKYFPLSSDHTLAVQARFLFQTGMPPFWRLGLLGGQEIMRGYYTGRYRDKNMACFQVEYRWVPVAWRLGVVAFGGFGDVAEKAANFRMGDFKISYGLGLRYVFSREQKLNIRLDLGFGQGTSGVYLTAAEAF